jgi:hypothetical protein
LRGGGEAEGGKGEGEGEGEGGGGEVGEEGERRAGTQRSLRKRRVSFSVMRKSDVSRKRNDLYFYCIIGNFLLTNNLDEWLGCILNHSQYLI